MPSREALLRSSRVPSHCRAHGQPQAARSGQLVLAPWSPASTPRLPKEGAGSLKRGVPLDSPHSKPALGWPGLDMQTNTPQLCSSRADNHHLAFPVLLCPLFQYKFHYVFEMAVPKSKFPTRAQTAVAGLGAVTQNRRQCHLGPGATSTQASPACTSPPLLVQIDPKESESLTAQKLTPTNKCSLETRNLAGRK